MATQKTIQTTPLQKKLQEKTQQLIAISKDAHFAESLIADILSLKAQMCVEPTELYVRERDVIEVVDLESVVFKICRTGILFHAKSGYSAWIEPRCRGLFNEITEVIKMKKQATETPDMPDANLWEQTFSAWVHILEMPIATSISPKILFDVALCFLKSFREESDRMLSMSQHEETTEDLMENARAAEVEETLQQVADGIKE